MADEFNISDQSATFSDPSLEASAASIDASLISIDASVDVDLSTRSSEATLATRASEATLATRASEATLATRASEATLATRASEATLATRASEATLLEVRNEGRNSVFSAIPSAVFNSTQTTADFTNLASRGAHIILDITAISGSNIVLKVQGKDATSGKYYDMLISQSKNSVGTTVFKIYPGYPPANNLTASDGLPFTWRLVITPNNANNITYSVGVNYLE